MLCFGTGYACCICTFGLSFLLPKLCVSDAEAFAREELSRINKREAFASRNVTWELQNNCCLDSYILISWPRDRPPQVPVLSVADRDNAV